jgi:hypothetical protein
LAIASQMLIRADVNLTLRARAIDIGRVRLDARELERIPIMFERSLHAARSFCILEG